MLADIKRAAKKVFGNQWLAAKRTLSLMSPKQVNMRRAGPHQQKDTKSGQIKRRSRPGCLEKINRVRKNAAQKTRRAGHPHPLPGQ
jgi:hypothetical protein